jgi:ElaB/YqjD/DUF883 family membrane-anchored ribosome-binding protein
MPSNSGSSGEATTEKITSRDDDQSNPVARATNAVSDAARTAVTQAAQMKDRASDLARTAADKIDRSRSTTADGLETAASSLRGRADRLPGGDKVTEFAQTAADQLKTTADYVRTHDVKRMMTDMKTLVKNNPGPSLVVAAVFGFLVGRAVTRD